MRIGAESLALVSMGALALAGCTEACACDTNSPAVKAWARCAKSEMRKSGELVFARRYVGHVVRQEFLAKEDAVHWAKVLGAVELKCGTVTTAAAQDRADNRSSKFEHNVQVNDEPVAALALGGVIDPPEISSRSAATREAAE